MHVFIYLGQFGLVVCRQTVANFLGPSLAGLLHFDLPVFLDQRVPAGPHLLLQLHIVVLLGRLSSKGLVGKRERK